MTELTGSLPAAVVEALKLAPGGFEDPGQSTAFTILRCLAALDLAGLLPDMPPRLATLYRAHGPDTRLETGDVCPERDAPCRPRDVRTHNDGGNVDVHRGELLRLAVTLRHPDITDGHVRDLAEPLVARAAAGALRDWSREIEAHDAEQERRRKARESAALDTLGRYVRERTAASLQDAVAALREAGQEKAGKDLECYLPAPEAGAVPALLWREKLESEIWRAAVRRSINVREDRAVGLAEVRASGDLIPAPVVEGDGAPRAVMTLEVYRDGWRLLTDGHEDRRDPVAPDQTPAAVLAEIAERGRMPAPKDVQAIGGKNVRKALGRLRFAVGRDLWLKAPDGGYAFQGAIVSKLKRRLPARAS